MDAPLQQAGRVARILKLSFIVAGFLLVVVTVRIPTQAQVAPSPVVEVVISIIAIMNAAAGFFLPRFLVSSKSNRPQSGVVQSPLQLWFTRCVLSLALFESCGLFAMVLYFLGSDTRIVYLLFATGIGSMLVWKPSVPPTAESGVTTAS